jgi:hypothetical protein
MAIDGYRYWVERHKLLLELAEARAQLGGRPDGERAQAEAALDQRFRERLDALYGEVRDQYEGGLTRN